MAADSDPILWNEDRETLRSQIEDVYPPLAGLYRMAIVLMDEPVQEGEGKARLCLVGHCFRELMNRLPDALRDVDGFPASKRGEEDRARDTLVATFEDFRGVPVEQPPLGAAPDSEQTEVVDMPKVLMDAVGRFVSVRKEGTRNVRERDSVAVLGAIDPLHPALKPWGAARDFFMSCTHMDRQYAVETEAGALASDDKVMVHIEIVEASLRVRLGPFFDSYAELGDLIAKINEMPYRVPSDDEVRAALALLGKSPLRHAFYSKVNNPHWVAALAKQDAFKYPPATKVMPDGMVRSDQWLENDFLTRMASVVSKAVADVLQPIAKSDNQSVRRGIMEAATLMAPVDVARLVPSMTKWPGDELGNFRIDPRDISKAIVNLLEGGEHPKGVVLANAFFTPLAPPQQPKYGIPEPVAGIEPHCYGEGLPAVARALGTSRIRTLERWLKAYQQHSNSFTGTPGFDTSGMSPK